MDKKDDAVLTEGQSSRREKMNHEAKNSMLDVKKIRAEFKGVLHLILEHMFSIKHSRLLTFQINFNGIYDDLKYKDMVVRKAESGRRNLVNVRHHSEKGFLHKKGSMVKGVLSSRNLAWSGVPSRNNIVAANIRATINRSTVDKNVRTLENPEQILRPKSGKISEILDEKRDFVVRSPSSWQQED